MTTNYLNLAAVYEYSQSIQILSELLAPYTTRERKKNNYASKIPPISRKFISYFLIYVVCSVQDKGDLETY